MGYTERVCERSDRHRQRRIVEQLRLHRRVVHGEYDPGAPAARAQPIISAMHVSVCHDDPPRARRNAGSRLPVFRLEVPTRQGIRVCGGKQIQNARGSIFLFGKLRKTDWLPVGPVCETEQIERSMESMSDDSEDEWRREMDEEYGSSEGESDWDDDKEEDNVFTCQTGLREDENAWVSDFDGLKTNMVSDDAFEKMEKLTTGRNVSQGRHANFGMKCGRAARKAGV